MSGAPAARAGPRRGAGDPVCRARAASRAVAAALCTCAALCARAASRAVAAALCTCAALRARAASRAVAAALRARAALCTCAAPCARAASRAVAAALRTCAAALPRARAACRLAALLLTLAAGAAAAAEVRLRTGEHPGFTRIVVEVGPDTGWRLGRTGGGYALDLSGAPGIALDLRGAFDRIPRRRVASLGFDPALGRLAIGLGCTRCHARAFRHPRGWVVIDLADGPPPPGSPHEAALGAAAAVPPPPPALPAWPALGPLAPDPARAGPEAGAGPAPLRLPSWIDGPAAPPPLRPAAPPGPSGPQGPPGPSGAAPPDTPLPVLPTPPEHAPDHTADPSGNLAAAEALLARELARAASQGLVALAVPLPAPPEADAAPGPLPVPPEGPAAGLQLGATTAIDRDAGPPRPAAPVAAGGAPCLPDSAFAIEDWGGDEPPAEGIARRRAALVGEFDAPDPAAVADLARYYLHLGLGAEAAATLAAFGADRPGERVLAAMAAAIDGGPGGARTDSAARDLLAAQAGCPGRAALWAVLAGAPPHGATDRRALVAAFSALPPGLRRHLGPGLGARYLEAGDPATAAAILGATLRAPGRAAAAADLLAARIDLAQAASQPAAAAARMRAAAAADDAIAPEAWAAALEAELGAGRPPPGAAATAAVLAVEAGPGPAGQRLARLSVGALLAAGDFAAAREALAAADRPPPSAFTAVAPALWPDYAAALAAGADDTTFLLEAFAARDRLGPDLLPPEVRRALAARFADLGFPEEVLRLVPAEAGDGADRLLRARALLATGAAAAAVGVVAGIEDPAADALRARAFLALGDAASAAERFRRAGETGAAARAALAAGDWARLAREGEGGLAALAGWLSGGGQAGDAEGTAPDTAPDPDGAGAPGAPPRADRAAPVTPRDSGPGGPAPPAAGPSPGAPVAPAGSPADPGAAGQPGADGPLAAAHRALAEVSALRAALSAALAPEAAAAPP